MKTNMWKDKPEHADEDDPEPVEDYDLEDIYLNLKEIRENISNHCILPVYWGHTWFSQILEGAGALDVALQNLRKELNKRGYKYED